MLSNLLAVAAHHLLTEAGNAEYSGLHVFLDCEVNHMLYYCRPAYVGQFRGVL